MAKKSVKKKVVAAKARRPKKVATKKAGKPKKAATAKEDWNGQKGVWRKKSQEGSA